MNTDLQNWEKSAENWDKNIATAGSYRSLLIMNALEKVLPSDMSNLKILDAGCGNGYFTNWLTMQGGNVIGVDGAEKMTEIAKTSYPSLKFETHDLQKATPFQNAEFDIILANMLLMHVEDISTFLNEAKRLLKPNGSFIFSVLHPCFNFPTADLHKTLWEKITFKKPLLIVRDYYKKTSTRYESHMRATLSHYHRTLEEYAEVLSQAGFKIGNIVEPHQLPKEFLDQHPKLEYAQRFPRFIFFNCLVK
jgi:2-polyprenyl-3-methyl-5-hydroxy-6-metoxy-1,4-benzoquinol methylase